MTSESVQARYRFKIQPIYDRDETAILVFRDWVLDSEPGYRIGTEVLSIDGGWIGVEEDVQLPMEKIPRITGYDTWHQDRMLDILDKWEQHIRDAVKADTGIELHNI